MTKGIFSLIGLIFSSSVLYAQITEVGKKKCYEKLKAMQGQKFAQWECGQLLGVVDCNEKLIYDSDTKTILSGNSRSPFSGTCETCHQNGLLERRITFVNGKENGVDTTYYKSGCPQVVRNHIFGVESGQWFFFYDSTQMLAWENNYNLGQRHGKQIYLTRDGDTTRLEYYSNGVLHGVKKSYYPDSKIEKEVNYKFGLMDGPYKKYNREGKLLEDLNFKEGKKDGELKYFYNDGKPLSVEHWIMDVKNGEFKTFFYQGHVQVSENYKKGILEGWFEERYPSDMLKHSILYKKGVVVEEHKFDEYGNETYTFGSVPLKDKEDDALPDSGKKKKRKKKSQKEKKTKKQ